MSHLRILLLFNDSALPPENADAEQGYAVSETVDLIGGRLVRAGFEVRRLGVGRDPQAMLRRVRAGRPDVVFNLFEGLTTQGEMEATVAGLLEWLGVPFTGSPAAARSLARDRYRVLRMLRGAGLPVPEAVLVDGAPCPPWPFAWPAVVKPASGAAGVGVEQAGVVSEQGRLGRRVAHVRKRYGPPVLVEEFIDGREISVHLLEEARSDGTSRVRVLPVEAVVSLEKAPGYRRSSQGAKGRAGTRASPATFPRSRAAGVGRMAVEAYHLVGCRDYA